MVLLGSRQVLLLLLQRSCFYLQIKDVFSFFSRDGNLALLTHLTLEFGLSLDLLLGLFAKLPLLA
jgi:hypothetical protein